MYGFLMALILIIAVLLILVVLLQPGKGDMISGLGGLGGQFSSVFGSRRAMDFLTKLTIGFAAAVLILSLVTNKFFLKTDEIQKLPTEGINVSAPATVPPPSGQMPEIKQEEKPQEQPEPAKPEGE